MQSIIHYPVEKAKLDPLPLPPKFRDENHSWNHNAIFGMKNHALSRMKGIFSAELKYQPMVLLGKKPP